MIDLDAVIVASERLEPLPSSVARLAALLSDETSSMRDIARVVGLDQALTARVLSAANSAALKRRVEIKGILDAVTRLGRGALLPLALGSHVKRQVSGAIPQYGIAEGELWVDAVTAALAVELMPSFVRIKIPAETGAAALLHHVGIVVLARFLDPDSLRYLQDAERSGGQGRVEAEQEILQVHHGEVGGLIAQHWALPEGIINGIIYHHTPDEHPDAVSYATSLAAVVAQLIARKPVSASEIEGMLKVMGLDRPRVMALCKAVYQQRHAVLQHYG
ncbi:HDOD domain-containing protein [Myxococcota bacterium]|nr:HDOD domain-containing protein [Myxococcota bacterium]MBU1429963.1 HDOD domain-containing protein [Myxococcota bacterium]MBU1896818.1 HDOD domain-containing protein [Myxococcota bacterium]